MSKIDINLDRDPAALLDERDTAMELALEAAAIRGIENIALAMAMVHAEQQLAASEYPDEVAAGFERGVADFEEDPERWDGMS